MRIISTSQALLDTLIELVGIKSGLVLSREHLIQILEQTYNNVDQIVPVLGGSSEWWQGNLDKGVAIRAEEIEANFVLAMYSIGAIPDYRTSDQLLINYIRQNASKLGIERVEPEAIYRATLKFSSQLLSGEAPELDKDFLLEYRRRDILDYSMPIQRQWDGVVPLNDLFESEDIPPNTTPENYFDQRYIDYLSAQPQELERIHWRQFEYLTAEYFRRYGYQITVTPPRGDGGIDVIAERSDEVIGPDLIVVQCRRYAKNNVISLNELKAFWTTIDDYGATKGLIVTTSHLTTGGHKFVEARKYRLSAIEGENVRKWIEALSSYKNKGQAK